jgi:hypothetical protein
MENCCVCFTATPGGEKNSLEQNILLHFGFKILSDRDI